MIANLRSRQRPLKMRYAQYNRLANILDNGSYRPYAQLNILRNGKVPRTVYFMNMGPLGLHAKASAHAGVSGKPSPSEKAGWTLLSDSRYRLVLCNLHSSRNPHHKIIIITYMPQRRKRVGALGCIGYAPCHESTVLCEIAEFLV
jgi:hypothetical protein